MIRSRRPRLQGSLGRGPAEELTSASITMPNFDGALCDERRGNDPELWFATDTASLNDPHHPALKICAACPVKEPCLLFALDERIEEGIWGGLFPTQRRNLARRRDAGFRIEVA